MILYTAVYGDTAVYGVNTLSDDPCNPAQKRKNGTAAAAFTASHRNRCSILQLFHPTRICKL